MQILGPTVAECEHTRWPYAYQPYRGAFSEATSMTKHIFDGCRQTFLSRSVSQGAVNRPQLNGNLSRPALTSSVSAGIHCNEGIFGKLETQEVHSCKIFPLGGLFDGFFYFSPLSVSLVVLCSRSMSILYCAGSFYTSFS